MKGYYGFKWDGALKEIISIPWVLYAIGENGEFNYTNQNELENEVLRLSNGKLYHDGFDIKIIDVPEDYIKKFNAACFKKDDKKSWEELNNIIDYVLEEVEKIYEEEHNEEWWKKGKSWDEYLDEKWE